MKQLVRIEQWFNQEPQVGAYKRDGKIDKWIIWSFCNVLPFLLLSFVINVTIIFAVPIEITESRWFWLKDPFSIITAYLFVKIVKQLVKTIRRCW